MKRWLRRIAVGLVTLLVVLILVGATWERIARSAAAKDYPPAGKLVDIGGRNIELDCRGQGSPTVVLVSGLDVGGPLSWTAVHDSIAKTTRTCGYSRAGIMWSDPGPAVTAKGVAEDLHAALEKGGEHPPFVMVGHSLGGPYLMTYTKYFGDQVAGVVMVDASHPDQIERFRSIVPAAADMPLAPLKIGSALSWTGLLRLQAVQGGKPMPNQSPEGIKATGAYISTSITGALKEAEALSATLAEAGTFRTLGNRPLVVLTAMLPMTPAELAQLKITEEKGKEFRNIWKSMHDEEASWSTRSQHIIVPDASHYIQFFRPDLVIGAVRSVVDSVRAGGQ